MKDDKFFNLPLKILNACLLKGESTWWLLQMREIKTAAISAQWLLSRNVMRIRDMKLSNFHDTELALESRDCHNRASPVLVEDNRISGWEMLHKTS